MKKLLVFLACFLGPGTAWGHPPVSLDLAYNNRYGSLTITAEHSVKDPLLHYIMEYIIEKDGQVLLRLEETRQTNKEKSVVSLSMPGIKKGTILKVTGICSQSGEKSTSIIIF